MSKLRPVKLPFTLTKKKLNPSKRLQNWVCLHGLFKSRTSLEPLISKIASESLNFYNLDMRDHSDAPHTDFLSVELISEDLAFFIQEHNLDSVSILGHSLGGKTAIETALRYPNLVENLFLIDMSPIDYVNNTNPDMVKVLDRWQLLCERLSDINVKGKNLVMLKDEISDLVNGNLKLLSDILEHLEEGDMNEVRWKTNIGNIAKNFPEIRKYAPEKSKQFCGRIKVVAGRDSYYVEEKHFEEEYAYFFPKMKKEDIVFLPGGHYLHEKSPDVVARVFDEFLSEIRED